MTPADEFEAFYATIGRLTTTHETARLCWQRAASLHAAASGEACNARLNQSVGFVCNRAAGHAGNHTGWQSTWSDDSEGAVPHRPAPTPQPGPVGREERSLADLLELYGNERVNYARDGGSERYAILDAARKAVLAAANKRVEAVRALFDTGSYTFSREQLANALDAATREGREGP